MKAKTTLHAAITHELVNDEKIPETYFHDVLEE